MTVVRHRHDHQLSARRVGVADPDDPARAAGLPKLGSDDLRSLRATTPDEHVMPCRGKSCGQTAALRARAAQDSYLHAGAQRRLANSGRVAMRAARVAMRAARVVMGSIVVRVPARHSVSGVSKDVLHDLYL
jgi:hypothetical protein